MTLQLEVGDTEQARSFYGAVFNHEPEYEPHDDFLEWRVTPKGETWVQVVGVSGEVRPQLNRVRFTVTDIASVHALVVDTGAHVSPISELPGVVRFFDFTDPWGNHLGYYQDLAPSGEQPVIGGIVHDESLFKTEDLSQLG